MRTRYATPWLAVLVVLSAFPGFLRAQAAVGYGIGMGRSAAMTAKAGSMVQNATKSATDRLAREMGQYPQSVALENRKKLEEKGRQGGGNVHVDSTPEKAAISVDGSVVAYTPTDLTIPEGKHVIEVKSPACLPWRKEIAVDKGGSLALKADLESRYKSSVNFPK
jgi:hypothetical protein